MLKRFIEYYKPHKKILILDMLASFLVALIGMGYPVITRYMLNDFIPNKKIQFIIIFAVALLLIYVIRMGLRYFIQYYGHIMGVRIQAKMRTDMFNKLEQLPYSYFDNHETGKIMSRMTNDLFEISELAHHGPENIFIATTTLIGSFIYLMIINWILGLICFGALPILIAVAIHFRKKMRVAFQESKKAIAGVNAQLESSISGIRVTKAYTSLNKEQEKFEIYNKEYSDARISCFNAMAKFFASSQFITDVFNVIVLLAGGLFLYAGYIDFTDYSTFIISINLFISPINQLIQFSEQFQNGAAGFQRFLEIMDEKEENKLEGDKVLENVEGNIIFKNVTFGYDQKNDHILDNVSFEIKKGETIALIGPTGGGKTTICHLIPRFYFLEKGEILIDNKPISDYTLYSLRRHIGIVQQDVFLFSGSIKDNILYGNPLASDEEVVEASKKANIYDFIESLPDGFNTDIGERGVKLSGGQKQRLSIARAFLKNPEILILDEATSALDNTTEYLIQSALNELAKGRTIITVAHRLSTIKNANKIMVVSNGKIIEEGNHEELIKLNGIYKKLYDLQFHVDDKDGIFGLNESIAMMH